MAPRGEGEVYADPAGRSGDQSISDHRYYKFTKIYVNEKLASAVEVVAAPVMESGARFEWERPLPGKDGEQIRFRERAVDGQVGPPRQGHDVDRLPESGAALDHVPHPDRRVELVHLGDEAGQLVVGLDLSLVHQ